MVCPDCGISMNRHAEKPLKSVPSDESLKIDSDLGGAVASIYCCPGCGKVEAEIEPRNKRPGFGI